MQLQQRLPNLITKKKKLKKDAVYFLSEDNH